MATAQDLHVLAVLSLILTLLCVSIACVWTRHRETLAAIYLKPSAFEISGDQAAAAASGISFAGNGDPPLSSRLSQSKRGFGVKPAAPDHAPTDVSSFSRLAKGETDKLFDDQPARVHVASSYSGPVLQTQIPASPVYNISSNSPQATPTRGTTTRRLSSSQQHFHAQTERTPSTGSLRFQTGLAAAAVPVGGSSWGSAAVPVGSVPSVRSSLSAGDNPPTPVLILPAEAEVPSNTASNNVPPLANGPRRRRQA
jgi:hypothetical protein